MVPIQPLSQGRPALRAVALVPLQKRLGPRFPALLKAQGLGRKLPGDPYALIPLQAFLALMEDAARQTLDPCFGARMGLAMRPGDLGPAGLLLALSVDIAAGLGRYARGLTALQSASRMSVATEGERLLFTYGLDASLGGPWPQDAELTLSSACSLIRSSFAPGWRPLAVEFAHPPHARAADLEAIYQAPVRFEQPATRLVIERASAHARVRDEDEALISLIERHIAEISLAGRDEGGVTAQVVQLLARARGPRAFAIERIAAELGQSPRSLQRRLTEAQTSFRALVQQVRQEALAAGRSAGLSRAELAWRLGFSDEGSLHRAEKGWRAAERSGDGRDNAATTRNSDEGT